MGRTLKQYFVFISNQVGKYYYVQYLTNGNPVVKESSSPVPIKNNPSNLLRMKMEFATNKSYNCLSRTLTYPFEFVLDGADILRYLDYSTNGFDTYAFMTIISYNPSRGLYELYYYGKFDFSKKKDNIKNKTFTINVLDYSAWGILSQKDDIKYQINCSASNPKAIKVLFDGITLVSRNTFQPVASAIDCTSYGAYLIVPLVLVNTDGDSSGVLAQDELMQLTDQPPLNYVTNFPTNFFYRTQYASNQTTIKGPFEYTVEQHTTVGFSLSWYLWRTTDTETYPSQLPPDRLLSRFAASGGLNGTVNRSFNIDQTFDLQDGERVLMVCVIADFGASLGHQVTLKINPKVNNIVVTAKTKVQPTTAYALRPLDLLQEIVSKASGGVFSINSNYFTLNNKRVITCGNALRQIGNAYITSSLSDWYKTFYITDRVALKNPEGNLYVEDFSDVYNQDNVIVDLGEILELVIEQDIEKLISAIEIGTRSQDYRRSSGRFEFNTTNKFSINVSNVKNQISMVTPYRLDGFGAEFLRLDYQGGSTKDNSGDSETFVVDITDEIDESQTLISNFTILEVNNAPLAPIITYPLLNDVISNNKPIIRGLAPEGETVNIYVDSVLDGSTVSDSNGNWSYVLVNALSAYETLDLVIVHTGVHLIEATYTDTSGEVDSRSINIVSEITESNVTYPSQNDSLYNNKPIFKGVGQFGDADYNIVVDGINIGAVTVDESCKWEIQSPILYNGNHTLSVNGKVTNFSVNSFTAVPIITSFIDGFILINNLPLVEGVGNPGETVNLYLDYYKDKPIGTAVIDATGNWSIQLIPLLQTDEVTVLTPIPNGEHTISTSLEIQTAPISVFGYKLDRPDYDTISGVTDNTVFNTKLTSKHLLLKHAKTWASIFFQNKNAIISFESGDKNQGFYVVIDGVTIKENSDVPIYSLGENEWVPIIISFKTKTNDSFNKTFYQFNNGGLIKASYKGNDLFFLPIGSMSIENISQNIQSWKLLVSKTTSLQTILNLYRNGISVQLMKNAIYHSDYNSLHFVKYNYSKLQKYNNLELYEDWFNNRNDRYVVNPSYIQKFQTTDVIRDQVISNGISEVLLSIFKCSDGSQLDTIEYTTVSPAPIPAPDIVKEVVIDFSNYPEDQYFFVIYANGTPVLISERIETRVSWEKTILLECDNSYNFPGFMFSTGIKSYLRIEGLVQKWSPDISLIVSEDEVGNNDMLSSIFSKKRTVLIGDGRGLPDYLYLKCCAAVILDTVLIEGVEYVVDKSNKFEEVARVDGFPMYSYAIVVELKNNNQAIVVEAAEGAEIDKVVLVVDASAFGIGGSQLINIEIDEEK